MSKITKATMGLVLAGVCGYFVLSHYRAESERKLLEKRRSDAQDGQRQQSIAALAEASGAIADWRRAFGGKRAMDSLFGAELASVLVRTDSRPVLFIASLRDLNTSTTGYEIEFDVRANLASKVRLILDCSSE